MAAGHLDDPRLRSIEAAIERGDHDRARSLLAGVGNDPSLRYGAVYLSTRLRFQSGELPATIVAERLRTLLVAASGEFPEVVKALAACERGKLAERWPTRGPSPALRPRSLFRRQDAGRYSIKPGEVETARDSKAPATATPTTEGEHRESGREVVDLDGARRAVRPRESPTPSRPPRESATPSARPRAPASPVTGRPASVSPSGRPRSGAPDSIVPQHPILDIAAAIDEGRHEAALDMLDEAGRDGSPAYGVLRARALTRAGRHKEAFELLRKVGGSEQLHPELRADCARQLLTLSRVEAAYEQAERAFEDDNTSSLVRLTLAWASIRTARRVREASALVDRAAQLIAPLETAGRWAALVLALRACVAAERGRNDLAIRDAKESLATNEDSIDALAALAQAHAQEDRLDECERWWRRLSVLDLAEAETLAHRLARLGFEPPAKLASLRAGSADEHRCDPVEEQLVTGDITVAVAQLEERFGSRLAALGKSAAPTAVAAVAAEALTTSPVFGHFAPYDLSLASLERLEAAVLTLVGDNPLGTDVSVRALALLAGLYAGETLRQAHDGLWEGKVAEPEALHVRAGSESWYPVVLVRERLENLERSSLADAVGASVAIDETGAWSHRVPVPSAAPAPWGDDPWPRADLMPQMGSDVGRSVVGLYCTRARHGALDGTTRSLAALESYVSLLARGREEAETQPAWARRPAVLCGAYVGELLRRACGGAWHAGREAGPRQLCVRLDHGTVATPVAIVYDRLVHPGQSESVTLAKYAQETMFGSGR